MEIDKNDFFRQATLKLCGNLNLGAALQDLIGYLKNLMPVDWIVFNIYEKELSVLKTIYVVTVDEIRTNPYISRISEEASRFIGSRELSHVRIINRLEEDPVTQQQIVCGSERDRQIMQSRDFSIIVMYLGAQNIKIGNVSICAFNRDRYTETHAEYVKLLHEPFTIALSNALRFNEVVRLKNLLTEDIQYLKKELKQHWGDDVIGGDFGLKGVMDQVNEVAHLDSAVLLSGETGVGKEVIANAIHTLSRRKNEAFIRVNCGAIPDSLMDSELFGHEKGSFTGASEQKRGCFERAHKGTIFLDEIAELSPAAQIRMLRVLQEREIIRVGGDEYIPVDIRVIAATNGNLLEMVEKGLFRSDLWYRLHVFPIFIPPLRERKEDIPALVHHFIEKKAALLKLPTVPKLAPGALERLQAYNWPGNVRELENVVERALILSRNQPLTFSEIAWPKPDETKRAANSSPTEFPPLDSVVFSHIRKALEVCKGKVNGEDGAASLLGINPNTLRHRMKKLGIEFGRGTRL